MKLKHLLIPVFFFFVSNQALAYKLLIPMDSTGQKNHLKAYGITFAALSKQIKVNWLLNYRGGSYLMETSNELMSLCKERGVSYEVLTERQYRALKKEINGDGFNGAIVSLDKTPRIAVYSSPDTKMWDDAVVLALDYASIPYERIYVDEVLNGSLNKYDWVHIHHEDFTGRYGKFWLSFRKAAWYQEQQTNHETLATKYGFKKVSQMQLAVAKKLREFVAQGGNLFAMCSATETFDIALAAEGTDICAEQFDGDKTDLEANSKLDFTNCLAFKDFKVNLSLYEYNQSNISDMKSRGVTEQDDYFYLYQYPAKENKISAMLCQNHTDKVKGFMGQSTGFRQSTLKPGIQVMGITARQVSDYWHPTAVLTSTGEARYLHGSLGKGTWTFYGGHDPEDYQHAIGDPATDLSKYPHSPGYRLILNLNYS